MACGIVFDRIKEYMETYHPSIGTDFILDADFQQLISDEWDNGTMFQTIIEQVKEKLNVK